MEFGSVGNRTKDFKMVNFLIIEKKGSRVEFEGEIFHDFD